MWQVNDVELIFWADPTLDPIEDPTLHPTIDPTLDPDNCPNWCRNDETAWQQKCFWNACGVCSECELITTAEPTTGQICKPWCTNDGDGLNAKRCTYDDCLDCDGCVELTASSCPAFCSPSGTTRCDWAWCASTCTEECANPVNCPAFCVTSGASWGTKCGWNDCGDCTECENVSVDTCPQWCHNAAGNSNWASVCGYNGCKNGCSEQCGCPAWCESNTNPSKCNWDDCAVCDFCTT